jgi:hypothetical protein
MLCTLDGPGSGREWLLLLMIIAANHDDGDGDSGWGEPALRVCVGGEVGGKALLPSQRTSSWAVRASAWHAPR